MLKTSLTLLSVGLLSISCVQIPFGNSGTKTYKNVNFEPPKNFNSLKAPSSDAAWIKDENGNIISYRTECPTQVRNLKSFAENLAGDFVNSKIEREEELRYNNREAYRVTFDADIESIQTSYDLLLFKKYNCLFIITHNGRFKSLNETASDFESFLSSFKVTQ